MKDALIRGTLIVALALALLLYHALLLVLIPVLAVVAWLHYCAETRRTQHPNE
jgi:hypothetical protein